MLLRQHLKIDETGPTEKFYMLTFDIITFLHILNGFFFYHLNVSYESSNTCWKCSLLQTTDMLQLEGFFFFMLQLYIPIGSVFKLVCTTWTDFKICGVCRNVKCQNFILGID